MTTRNWRPVFEEALDLLVRYLQIDTSNPPGNEWQVCDYLEGVLNAEGFETTRYRAGEGRDSLRAVYRGDGSKRP